MNPPPPQTRTIEYLADTLGHPYATLGYNVPEQKYHHNLHPSTRLPSLKCPGTKGAIPTPPGGSRLTHLKTLRRARASFPLKSLEMYGEQITRICPLFKLNFPTFFCAATTQNVNHYPPKFLVPCPNEPGTCRACGVETITFLFHDAQYRVYI